MNADKQLSIPQVMFSDPAGPDVVRFDFDRDREGDLAMLQALREELSGPVSLRGTHTGVQDRFRYALQLLGEDA